MNRFTRQDSNLEKTIKQVVRNNFPAVDIAGLSGPNIESFAKNSMSRLPGGVKVVNIVENNAASSKRLMLWSTSRWGGSHVAK
jgi:hypothetical protein